MIIIKNKQKLKEEIRTLLSSIIDHPNQGVLSVKVAYDPNLDIVTLSYWDIDKEIPTMVFNEHVSDIIEELGVDNE